MLCCEPGDGGREGGDGGNRTIPAGDLDRLKMLRLARAIGTRSRVARSLTWASPLAVARSGRTLSSSSAVQEYSNKTIEDYVTFLKTQPIAVMTEKANDQHYDVPVSFFENVMGVHKKYSCCLFENGDETLDDAEDAMLKLTCERANLSDGQEVAYLARIR